MICNSFPGLHRNVSGEWVGLSWSDYKAPIYYKFLILPVSSPLHQGRRGIWNSSHTALASGSRWLSSNHSPSLWVFLYIQAHFEKNTRGSTHSLFEEIIIVIPVNGLQRSRIEGWQKSSGLGRRKRHLCETPILHCSWGLRVTSESHAV